MLLDRRRCRRGRGRFSGGFGCLLTSREGWRAATFGVGDLCYMGLLSLPPPLFPVIRNQNHFSLAA